MTIFSVALALHIEQNSGISDIQKVYIESAPLSDTTIPFIVMISDSGDTFEGANRNRGDFTRRILVRGEMQEALEKAEEIYNFLIPDEDKEKEKNFSNSGWKTVKHFPVSSPQPTGKVDNLWIIEFSITFKGIKI